jgi:hypothetical protein
MDEWLHVVKDVLIQEGFRETVLQVIKPAQVFGLVKKLDGIWEMHVRGFDDGRLESEIEISRDYLEHLNDKYRRDATLELTRLLDTYQTPYEIKGEPTRLTAVLFPPKEVTPWKPLVAIAGIAAFIAFLCWRGKGKG